MSHYIIPYHLLLYYLQLECEGETILYENIVLRKVKTIFGDSCNACVARCL